jgi:hypothetical protein
MHGWSTHGPYWHPARPHAEVTLLKSFGGNGFHVAEVEEGDIPRIAELVEHT